MSKPTLKGYVAVKGDEVDEMWAYHLNKAEIELNVVRIEAGKYLFGTRNVTAKIVAGKLVVRVGGGYMSADEFIAHYGQSELLKMGLIDDVKYAKALTERRASVRSPLGLNPNSARKSTGGLHKRSGSGSSGDALVNKRAGSMLQNYNTADSKSLFKSPSKESKLSAESSPKKFDKLFDGIRRNTVNN